MDEFEYYIKVPKDRLGVLIGEKGEKKRELEEELGVEFDIDSEENEVRIHGEDSIKLFVAQDVVKAIGRGFNPDIAKQLAKTDYVLELMEVTEYAPSKKAMIRLKGRVIGEGGKSRSTVEELADVRISVYGKTIGIIGEAESVQAAKRAIDMLLGGAPHATVFRFLEKLRREKKKREWQESHADQ